MRLDGNVALITGAGSGLGRRSAQLGTKEDAKVAVVDLEGDRAEQTVNLVQGAGSDAIAITADVADRAQIFAAVAQTVDHPGKVDIAWANAEVVSRGGVPSVASLIANHGIAMYPATTAGVNGLVRWLALDLGRFGIRINTIAPVHGRSPNFLMAPGVRWLGRVMKRWRVAGTLRFPRFRSSCPVRRPCRTTQMSRRSWPVTILAISAERQSARPDGGTLSRVGMRFEEDLKLETAG